MPRRDEAAAIYTAVFEACSRIRFSDAPWSRFAPDCDVRIAPKDLETLLPSLCAAFDETALIASRVAVRAGSGALQLSPGLRSGQIVIALRSAGSETAVDLLTSTGCLSGALPIAAAVRDLEARPELLLRVAADRKLFVAFDLADVAVLRALGFAAALASPPAQMHASRLGCVSSESAPYMVVVGWSPRRLNTGAPRGLVPFCAHLHGLLEYLQADIGFWSVWMPTEYEVQAIRFALTHGDANAVRDWFLEETSHFSPDEVATGSGNVNVVNEDANTLQEAWTQLRKVPQSTLEGTERRREAWSEYEQRLERDVVRPVMRAALAEPDLQRRDLLLSAAELTRVRHQLAARVADQISGMPHAPSSWRAELPVKEIQVLLSMVDRSVRLNQELRKAGQQVPSWRSRWGRGGPK